jgi:hypothetical protein
MTLACDPDLRADRALSGLRALTSITVGPALAVIEECWPLLLLESPALGRDVEILRGWWEGFKRSVATRAVLDSARQEAA